MSLIFDSFKTKVDAEKFAATVWKRFKRKTSVYNSQRDAAPSESSFHTGRMYVKNNFPFPLNGPIVLVERHASMSIEVDIQNAADHFGGALAGM